jgi:hypothetical protein
MPVALSLHIGLNVVDAAHYGSTYPLSGCHNDARDMEAIARAAAFETTTLLDADATAARFLRQMQGAAGRLGSGDTFLLTYAGHGAQVPDETGDEADSLDETWVLFDRMLLDDEIYAALARFSDGVRILVISDSCHSGSVTRFTQYENLVREGPMAPLYVGTTQRFRTPNEPGFGRRVWDEHAGEYGRLARGVPGDQRARVRAAVIQISGCQDDQLSADGVGNGLFTGKLKEIWAAGAFRGSIRAFGQAIRALMPPTQCPNYLTFGNDVASFEKERPFTASRPNKKTTNGCLMKGTDQMNGQNVDEGNWSEVRAELERKFKGWRPPSEGPEGQGSYVGSPSDQCRTAAASESVGGSRAASGPPIVRAFWWGFHIECSSQGLRDFVGVADPINTIAAAIGPVTGPAAPFVLAAAAFIAGMLQTLRNLDQGNGVYISMSWFALGIFIPTTVPVRGITGSVSRGPGEPYEQAGDPWRRVYEGGPFGLRLEEDIYWNLPDGTVRENVIVHTNPPNFGNIYFNHWLSDDPTVGHFRLHVGVAWWNKGVVELRMMIRDAAGRRSMTTVVPGPRALTASEL